MSHLEKAEIGLDSTPTCDPFPARLKTMRATSIPLLAIYRRRLTHCLHRTNTQGPAIDDQLRPYRVPHELEGQSDYRYKVFPLHQTLRTSQS